MFDKLTGGGVDWLIELDQPSGPYQPGAEVSGRVRLTPQRAMEARASRVGLSGVEHYVLSVLEQRSGFNRDRSDRHDRDDRWFSDELFRQDVDLAGSTSLAAQTPVEYTFTLRVPAEALPSFDSEVLRLRWVVRAWIDAGGVDPSTERDIVVAPPAGHSMVSTAALAATTSDGPAALSVDPLPIVVGQPFRGSIESPEQLDVGRTRIEIKQRIQTNTGMGGIGGMLEGVTVRVEGVELLGGSKGVQRDRVLWTGQLTAAGAGQAGQRYEFSGQLPDAPVATVTLPHGSSTETLDLVISRRLLPDRHISRPVAIVSSQPQTPIQG